MHGGYLSLIYILGMGMLQAFQKDQDIINNPRIIPIHRKLNEIGEILKYIDITSFVNELRGSRNNGLSSCANILERKSSHTDKDE